MSVTKIKVVGSAVGDGGGVRGMHPVNRNNPVRKKDTVPERRVLRSKTRSRRTAVPVNTALRLRFAPLRDWIFITEAS